MKTSELLGTDLDRSVARALGWKLCRESGTWGWFSHTGTDERGEPMYAAFEGWIHNTPEFSTDWAEGGPIIEREKIWVQEANGPWAALYAGRRSYFGPTPLIAAMRCYVASKLGDEVDIPKELK